MVIFTFWIFRLWNIFLKKFFVNKITTLNVSFVLRLNKEKFHEISQNKVDSRNSRRISSNISVEFTYSKIEAWIRIRPQHRAKKTRENRKVKCCLGFRAEWRWASTAGDASRFTSISKGESANKIEVYHGPCLLLTIFIMLSYSTINLHQPPSHFTID